jgi:hypothetical protein
MEGKMELSSTSSELKHHGTQYATATTRAANRTLQQGTATYGDHVRVAAIVDPFGRPVAATTAAAWEPAPKPAPVDFLPVTTCPHRSSCPLRWKPCTHR